MKHAGISFATQAKLQEALNHLEAIDQYPSVKTYRIANILQIILMSYEEMAEIVEEILAEHDEKFGN